MDIKYPNEIFGNICWVCGKALVKQKQSTINVYFCETCFSYDEPFKIYYDFLGKDNYTNELDNEHCYSFFVFKYNNGKNINASIFLNSIAFYYEDKIIRFEIDLIDLLNNNKLNKEFLLGLRNRMIDNLCFM